MNITINKIIPELNNQVSITGETEIGDITGFWMSKDIIPEEDVTYECELFIPELTADDITVTKGSKTPACIQVGLEDIVYFKGICESKGDNYILVSFGDDWIETLEIKVPEIELYDSVSFSAEKEKIEIYAISAV